MRQYRKTMVETKVVDKIICNRCGRVITVDAGVPCEETLSVNKRWGYFSRKDNREDNFDLCERCYDEIVKDFKIPVTITEQIDMR